VVLETHSRVVASVKTSRVRPRSFVAGLHAERLFWRSLAGASIFPALVMHLVEVVRHAIVRAPLGSVPALAGRAVALLQFGMYVPRYLQLQHVIRQGSTGVATAARAVDAQETIRIDGAQPVVGRPRTRERDQELGRSASLRKSA
jgi:hypothetical protein